MTSLLKQWMDAEFRAGKARKESGDPQARDYHNAPHSKTLGRPRPAPPTTACTECGEDKRWHPAGEDGVRRVIIESPYAGDVERNLRYLRACMADCLARGEAPFASHGLYTQPGVLDDDVPSERSLGIRAGFAWREVAEATVVYTDLGMSTGMRFGVEDAERMGRPVEHRKLGGEWAE